MKEVNELRNTPFDNDPESRMLPDSLNTLTILTFIGCGFTLLLGLWQFANAREGYDRLEKLQESGDMDKIPSFMKSFAGPEALEMARKMYENKVPLLITGLVSVALCVYGAVQMRALLKQGYYVWLLGEILPLVSGVIFLGSVSVTGIYIFGPLFTALFILLYSMQLKHLR